ncbi:putative ribosomal protein L33 [Helianthus annuus]|nr:putative ribosomal protein L33 [Helianthus annuus]KAJ0505493.1 putative ribosomal protein L33 [Helianthus annuus]KAJ0862915.1 putative ribosomal protein L33 [Helianthus annuus]KAJ0866755.1 putative ribosomal protein L33 [Helianthus annuus]
MSGLLWFWCISCNRLVWSWHMGVRSLWANRESTGISRYITQKNRHNTPNRLELLKFCPYCYIRFFIWDYGLNQNKILFFIPGKFHSLDIEPIFQFFVFFGILFSPSRWYQSECLHLFDILDIYIRHSPDNSNRLQ